MFTDPRVSTALPLAIVKRCVSVAAAISTLALTILLALSAAPASADATAAPACPSAMGWQAVSGRTP